VVDDVELTSFGVEGVEGIDGIEELLARIDLWYCERWTMVFTARRVNMRDEGGVLVFLCLVSEGRSVTRS
jgi:hypothetical protein